MLYTFSVNNTAPLPGKNNLYKRFTDVGLHMAKKQKWFKKLLGLLYDTDNIILQTTATFPTFPCHDMDKIKKILNSKYN